MKIPKTEIPKPLYNPGTPSLEKIFAQQSIKPLNYLSLSAFPISTPSLVLAKSRGYTNSNDVAPAHPPAIKDPRKNIPGLVFESYLMKIF